MVFKELFKDKINQKKRHDAKRIIIEKNLFDYEYYMNQYPEVTESGMDLLDHYLTKGYLEGKNPSNYFDTDYYLRMYGDVRVSNFNPLEHYALYGMKEGRKCTTKLTQDIIETVRDIVYKEGIFDEEYYLEQCPQLKDSSLDIFKHYLYVGSEEGLNPSEKFDTIYYKLKFGKFNRDNLNPIVFYALHGIDEGHDTKMQLTPEQIDKCVKVIDDSNTFDDDYYLQQSPELKDQIINLIEHYVTKGAYENKNPSKTFDTDFYLKQNPDVRAFSENPYVHYILNGKKEGRISLKTKTLVSEENSKLDDIYEEVKLIENSGLFDKEYYLEKYDDVKYTLEGPIYHYLTKGVDLGYNPSKEFSTNYYLYANKDVDKNKINPLVHYITVGIKQGRERTIKYLDNSNENYYSNLIGDNVKSRQYRRFDSGAPLVSIIILNRNGQHHLKRLFKTFKKRTDYPNYEIIVVDNNSTDESIDVINEYESLPIKLIKNKVNKNFSEANNQAVEISKGDYLLFLNNDIEVLDGWLNHLMDTALTEENVGAVGSRLVYPDCSESELNKGKSYTIQHGGIVFRQKDGSVKPYNQSNGLPYKLDDTQIQEKAAVTAACLLIKKSSYDDVEGFDNEYNYGYEDVDLCLKLYKKGYKNYYNPNSVLYHYEFGTQETNQRGLVRNRRISNTKIFNKKWNTWLKKQVLMDKLNQKQLFTEDKLKIALTVTEKGKHAQAGDYFTALGLSDQLNNLGYETKFLAMRYGTPDVDWYNVDDDVDVVISLLDRYDINKIKTQNSLLIKIAWVRNWIDRWVEQDYFEDFDMILASSKKSAKYIEENTGFIPTIFPIATDTTLFNENIEKVEEYLSDYCFTGSYWDAEREIIEYLKPEEIGYEFNLYGANWNKIPHLKQYHKGFIDYHDVPSVYASTKIVIDDANHVTKEYGSVNSRIFDTIASGRLIITNGTLGNEELFNGEIPEYHSQQQLTEQIKYYLENPDKYDKKVKQLQKMVLENHTYQKRAKDFITLLKDYVCSTKIIIKAPIPRSKNKLEWGDYYFGVNLQKEFNRQGNYSKIQLLDDWQKDIDGIYDIVLVLRGLSIYEPKSQHYNIMWNISHPDDITLKEYNDYDKVYVASTYWTQHLKEVLDVDVESLLQCTDTTQFKNEFMPEYESELLFVGNSRLIYRKILKDLLPTDYDLHVYGADWEGLVDDKYLKGEHISNKELYKAYSSTKVLLNDHWDDMKERGFISNRIFDAIACKTVILTDHVRGIEDLFPEAVVYYDDKDELDDKIKEALNKKDINSDLVKEHTYQKRAEKIIADYNQVMN